MPSLWSPTDWPQRLAELQAPTGDLKEAPLRRDVRSLGTLLGEVLREQAGEPLYEAVEALRRSAIARREAEAPQNGASDPASASARLQQARAFVRSYSGDLHTAYQLARAFSFYFELINLAETNHRKRRRLSHQLTESITPSSIQRGDLRVRSSRADRRRSRRCRRGSLRRRCASARPTRGRRAAAPGARRGRRRPST